MFKIILKRSAEKSLKNLDKRVAKRIDNAFQDFKDYPVPVEKYDIKKVADRKHTYRLRISKYRVIYKVDWENSEVNILKIEKKDEETYRL